MKDIRENKKGLIVLIKQRNLNEPGMLFCDKIEYVHKKERNRYLKEGSIPSLEHNLMFYDKGKLIFKVQLDSIRRYGDINEALKISDIKISSGI